MRCKHNWIGKWIFQLKCKLLKVVNFEKFCIFLANFVIYQIPIYIYHIPHRLCPTYIMNQPTAIFTGQIPPKLVEASFYCTKLDS